MWKSVPCKISELRLDRTLACGQSFRWKEHQPGIWTGVIGKEVWRLKQTETDLLFQVFQKTEDLTNSNTADKHNINGQSEVLPVKQKRRKEYGVKRIKQENDPIQEKLKQENDSVTFTKVKQENDSVTFTIVKQENDSVTLTKVKQEDEKTWHQAFQDNGSIKGESKDKEVIKDYFQLHINLEDLYQTWAKADKHFHEISQNFSGIRMIRQDPVECLFSFICSSNNNITRITSMIDNLTKHYGEKILELDDQPYYTFPKVKALSVDGVEEKLRSLGFGYRAKFIQTSAQFIEKNGGDDWLYSLRTKDYNEAKSELMKLCGVGAKVADCVALFCLDKPGSIPVDTHVWQIAARDYMPKLKQSKSLTDKLYEEIGNHFRELWGPYAGWAHSVLFTADLRQFKDTLKKSPAKRKAIKTEAVMEENQKIKQRKNKK